MKKLIAGNWKMNGSGASARALAGDIAKAAMGLNCDLAVCPAFPHIPLIGWELREHKNIAPHISLGAQDCSDHEDGAYTGDISAAMLKDIGCSYVILGHSERRLYHKENDELVASKAARAHQADLITIICVGETLAEREAGREKDIVAGQLSRSIPPTATASTCVIAYEPVWAIGTGKTATPEHAGDMHAFIRGRLKGIRADLEKCRILYGGSMKPDNAAALLATPNVEGGLIGGASLKAADFIEIAKAAV